MSNDTVKQEMSNTSGGDVDKCIAKTLKEEEVESARAQMSRVREENVKLKMLLEQIENDYKSLQVRFLDIVQQAGSKKSSSNNGGMRNEDMEEHDLVSLRLGRTPTETKKEDTTSSSSKTREEELHSINDDGLKLGLDCNFQDSTTELKNDSSPGNSLVETKEDETWPPSKVLKTTRSGEDEHSQPNIKRARVSVRARCDAPTLHDGCQWRKYGQKIAKGNPCPRAYYRCTVAPSCPVRKQVQRCAEDMSILITTYEGTHNHPLPISATAMASTTSAAASMLLSGSSTSSHSPSGFGSPAATTPASMHLSDNIAKTTRPFYLPMSSPQFPTITLDLTNPSASSTHFNNLFTSNFHPSPRFPSTSLNFSSPETSMLPSVWSNGYTQQPYHKTSIDSSPLSKPSQEHYYQPCMEKNNQQALAETLTKAITSDPSIRSVLAAAISSMVAGGSSTQGVENSSPTLKWAEHVPVLNSNPLTSNGKGCASTFLGQPTSFNSQRLQQAPPLAFSVSNSSSMSTVDNREQRN